MNFTEEQKSAIFEYGKNIIVSAGAGSGKTEVLSQRVLEHVKKGIHINEMLILTFTNASAAEMKERIRNKLISNNLNEEAQKVDISYITTFDSYALSILKKYSYILNMSPKINIIESSIITLKKEEFLREIFDEYYLLKDELFLKLVNDFCIKDDNNLFCELLSLYKQLETKYKKEEYLNNYIDNYYQDNNYNKLILDYLNILLDKINNINNLLDFIKDYVDTDYFLKLESSLNNLLISKTYDDIKINVNNVKMPSKPKNSEEIVGTIKDKISSIIKDIKNLTTHNDIGEIKNTLESTKDYVDIIIRILLKLDEKIMNYKISVSSFEFIDIAKFAIKIVEEKENIRNELKNSYKEILIDEYQDTSDLQEIFINNINNNNVYMVGDIKQSIYRFRNANPMLFKSKYDIYSKGIEGIKIDLNNNFRSRDTIVNSINKIFSLLMDNNLGGASYFDEHQMIFGQKDYLNVNKENYDLEILNYNNDEKKYSKEEIEIFTIVKDIKDKINNNYQILNKNDKKSRSITYKDIAIIIDKSKSFNLYKKIFEYFNIPVTIMKDKTISDSIDLSIIKNIYNLIIKIHLKEYDKSFKYSFVSILRSYLFNYHDNDILNIMVNNNYFDNELFKICQSISYDLDILNNNNIYELILDKFDMVNKLCEIGNINEHLITLDTINDILSNLDDLGYSPYLTLDYLNNIYTKELDIKIAKENDNQNSVKIMTIHTSKGLEYPICYFPGLDSKFNLSDLNSKIYFSNAFGFVIPYLKDNILNNTIVKTLLKNSYLKEEISEKIRLLYVALTRAREKIILITSISENELAYNTNGVVDLDTRMSYKSFLDMLSSIYKSIKNNIKQIDINKLNITDAYKYPKLSNININDGNIIDVKDINIESKIIDTKRLSKDEHYIYSKDEKDNIELGLRMHYLFEILDFNNPNFDNLKDSEISLLKQFLNTNIYKDAKNIYKELEFIYEEDDSIIHGIIDLLLVFKDKNIIIDYKLKNIDDEAYLKQLNGYKKYVSKINNLPTSIYLYSILEGKLIKK